MQVLMSELTSYSSGSQSDYLTSAGDFLLLHATSVAAEGLGTGRIENYVEETVPTYSDPLFKAHFRMRRSSFEVKLSISQV
jgi:hypothetical protein